MLTVHINVNEALVQNRNIIIEAREAEMADYKARYDQAAKNTYDAIDKTITLADTSERRSTLEAFYKTLDRSAEAGLKSEPATASEIALFEGAAARTKVR
jgi:hypothetical protein